MTLWGLSLLFIGGFVLWVYGSQKARLPANDATHTGEAPRSHLMQWFVLYGAVATFAGVGCLLTAAIMVI
jgi:hypothetical protein